MNCRRCFRGSNLNFLPFNKLTFFKQVVFLVIVSLFFLPSEVNSLPLKSYEDWYLTQETLSGKAWESSGKSAVENLLVKQSESLPFDSNALYFVQRELSPIVEYAYRRRDLKKLDEVVSLLLPARSWLVNVPLESTDNNVFMAKCWVTKGKKTNLEEEIFPGDESIKLQDVSFLPSSGVVMVEEEVIFYRDRDSSNNLLLGVNVREHHPAGATVYQLSESVLNSAQFIYLLARVLSTISSLPPSQRSANMTAFLTCFTPIVSDHLYRWQYYQSIKWWSNSFISSCSHYRRLNILYSGRYGSRSLSLKHKRVADYDLWIIASTAELLGSAFNDSFVRQYLDKKAPGVSSSYLYLMKRYLKLGIRLVKQRTEVNIPGFRFIFDRGTMRDHPDYLYARFFEEATRAVITPDGSVCFLPRLLSDSEKDLYKDVNATFDIGHGMRLPFVYLSLYRFKGIVKENFPDYQVMKALGAQFYEKVYNRSSSKPLFKVYLNGVNGWYRVDYAGRVGYGIGPWKLSHVVFYGSYTQLIPFEPRLKKITRSLANMAMDDKRKNFRLAYYDKVCDEEGKIYPRFYSQLIFGSAPNLDPPGY